MKNVILLASTLSVPALATDESPRFFIGLKGGYQWALDDTYNQSNPEGTIVGVYGGLQFTPSWSWDVGYQHHEKLKATATSVDVKTWLIESALRYDWYLQDNLSLYGRLGVAYWDMEKTINLSDKLEASGFSPLGEVGGHYHFNSNAKAVVVGHTDSTGSASYNQKLSEYRAQTSVSKLIELGVAPTQLEWQGEGESRPIADNNTEDGRAKNRRVEITITNFKI
ncbi:OmpA family protein [Vibrio sp. Hep-1b-8]|uniref:OmpA family protein n=1 Tax=Vibrio sp. Hep-1b-8 TaxID=2144187 RepID=UPI00110FFDC7|nr:OmpA family protein [Vibrio sp. Hep-1b-8]TMX31541.1 hypothetical protein DA100_19485 [Vibrio sp. Hep-1b-8]